MKFANAKTHYDLISELYKEAERAFQQVGGIAPSINDLYHSENWRYCSTEDPKLKGKVGYICAHDYLGDNPRVRITVHSFAQGGQSAYFDSWQYEKEEKNLTQVIKPVVRHENASRSIVRQKKEQAEAARKHQLYLSLLKEWENGSPFIFSHPYIINKGISEVHSARLISKDGLDPNFAHYGEPSSRNPEEYWSLSRRTSCFGRSLGQCPQSFDMKVRKPLMVGVKEALAEWASGQSIEMKDLGYALGYYTNGIGYLKAILKQDQRVNLQGEPVEEVTKERALTHEY